MRNRCLRWLTVGVGLLAPMTIPVAAQEATATRLSQNPLITVDTASSLGGNVNGPTVIRVPE